MQLSWEFEVISRAISYPNLSVAASQIGLSQSQLSRILKRVEEALGLTLLDRDSKRKVSWNPIAHDLVSKFLKASRQWDADLQHFTAETEHKKRLRIGCLEGVSEAVVDFVSSLIHKEGELEEIDLDVLDLSDLEKQFFEGEFDLIFTSRSPGKKKFTHSIVLGFQKFENFKGSSDWVVRTPFEMANDKKMKQSKKRILTKSLWVKRLCVEKLKASAAIPSRLKSLSSGRTSQDISESLVFLIGAEELSRRIWSSVKNIA
jgi:hypothetical protein